MLNINRFRDLSYRASWCFDSATEKQIVAVNSILSKVAPDRAERLLLLESLFGRTFSTSRSLTKGEASAIMNLCFDRTSGDGLKKEAREFLEGFL